MINIKKINKKIKYVLLVIFAFVILLLVAETMLRFYAYLLQLERRGRHKNSNITIACLGDSYTFGLGVKAKDAYPNRLGKLLKITPPFQSVSVVNLGFPGLEDSTLLTLMPELLDKYSPKIALVMIGHNFFLFKSDLKAVIETYRTIVLNKNKQKFKGHFYEDLRIIKLYRYFYLALREKLGFIKNKLPGKYPIESGSFPYNAYVLINNKQYREALSLSEDIFLAAEAEIGDKEDYWFMVARLHELLNENSKAEVALRNVIALNPNNAEALYRLGLLFKKTGSHEAEELFKQAYYVARKELYENNLTSIIGLLREKSIVPILLTYPYEDLILSAIIRKAARKTNTELIDIEAIFIEKLKKEPGSKYLLPDGHCNAEGNEVVAWTIRDFLKNNSEMLLLINNQ